MELWSAVASFALVAAVLTITPGLDTALVLRTAARHGRRAGFAAALGINTGVLAWAIAAAVGVSALLAASETAYTVLRYAGAACMLYLGLSMIWSGLRHSDDDAGEGEVALPPRPWDSYRKGLLVNLMNPKIGVFSIALLPQFIPPGHSAGLVGALLGVVHNVEGLAWFGLLILLVDRARVFLQRPSTQRWIDGIAGTAIVGFGLKLGFDRA